MKYYTREQIDAIAAKLRAMPPIEKKQQKHSKQDAIKIISKEITELRKRGYSLEQISESLRGEGLSIATPTLKNYIQRAKPTKKPSSVVKKDTPPAPPAEKRRADTSKATFTVKPDNPDI